MNFFGEDTRVQGVMYKLYWANALGLIFSLCALVMRTLLITHELYVNCAIASVINLVLVGLYGFVFIVLLKMDFVGYGVSMLIYGIFSFVSTFILAQIEFSSRERRAKVSDRSKKLLTFKSDKYMEYYIRNIGNDEDEMKKWLHSFFSLYEVNMTPQFCIRHDIIGGMVYKSILAYCTNIHIFLMVIFYPKVMNLVSSENEERQFKWLVRFAAVNFCISFCMYIYPRNLICYGVGDLLNVKKGLYIDRKQRETQMTAEKEFKSEALVRNEQKNNLNFRLKKMQNHFFNYLMHWGITDLIISILLSCLVIINTRNLNVLIILGSLILYFLISLNTFLIGVQRVLGQYYMLIVLNSAVSLVLGPIFLYFFGIRSQVGNIGGLGTGILVMILDAFITCIIYFISIFFFAEWVDDETIVRRMVLSLKCF